MRLIRGLTGRGLGDLFMEIHEELKAELSKEKVNYDSKFTHLK